MTERVYLDDNATTAMATEAVDAMCEAMRALHGNASSIHGEGIAARLGLERARRSIEGNLDAPRDSLLFTGGGTEANVLGMLGPLRARRGDGPPPSVVASGVDHKVVVGTLGDLVAAGGIVLRTTATDRWGSVRPPMMAEVLSEDTRLVVLTLANNEVGALSPIADLVSLVRVRAPRAHVHVDAVQAAGRIPLSVTALGADTVAIAAHKFRGPKGVGGLFVMPGAVIAPVMHGGGQERRLRPGTENVAGAVGMAVALGLAVSDVAGRGVNLRNAREAVWDALLRGDPRLLRNSPEDDCLPGTLNLSLPGADGRALVRLLDERGFAISAGSACTSSGEATSHVLEALHPADPARVRGSVRISLAWPRPQADLDRFVEAFAKSTGGLTS